MAKPKNRHFTSSSAADKYVKKVKAQGYNVQVLWRSITEGGGYTVKVLNRESNPGILKQLRKGFKGTVKLVGKTLQFRS